MKTIYLKFFGISLLSFALTLSAHARDVRDVKGLNGDYVKVENLTDQRVSFSFCRASHPGQCDAIGDAQGYTLDELRTLRSELRLDGAARLAAPLVVGAVLSIATMAVFGVGGLALEAAGMLFITDGTQVTFSLLMAGSGVTAGTTGAVWAGRKLHPVKKLKLANKLSEKVITDQDITVDSIDKYVDDLRAALALVKR